ECRTWHIAHNLIKEGNIPAPVSDILRMAEFPCNEDEGSKLLEDLMDIFNELSKLCDRSIWVFDMHPSIKPDSLFKELDSYIKKENT
ncbi:MAG: hypothetical protein ABH934_01030, partial [Chloroflexota bacterium]